MTLRTLFTINIPISFFFGLTCLLIPEWLMSLYGAEISPAGAFMTRLAGAAYLGFGVLAYQARSTRSAEFALALALGLFVQDSIGAALSLFAQINGLFNALGWTTVVLYLLLALGYGYFRFIKEEPWQAKVPG